MKSDCKTFCAFDLKGNATLSVSDLTSINNKTIVRKPDGPSRHVSQNTKGKMQL